MTDATVLILQQGTLVLQHCHLHKSSIKNEWEQAVSQYANNWMLKRDFYMKFKHSATITDFCQAKP